jgi:hypothetical protein
MPETAAPCLLPLIRAGATAGGLLSGPAAPSGTGRPRGAAHGRRARPGRRALTRGPAGLPLVAPASGGFQPATVPADARFQQRIDDAGRATLTSVAGLGTDLATITVYGTYAEASTAAGHSTAFAVFTVPYPVTAGMPAAGARIRRHPAA